MPTTPSPNVLTFPGRSLDAGGEGVSEDVWNDMRRRLEASVRKVCPPHLADRSDDLVQVAMLRVMDVARKSEGVRVFTSSYLYRAAYSALIDEIRRLRRRQEVGMEDEDGTPMPLEAELPDPERHTASREAGQAITECLGTLVRPRRLAVTLYLQGHGTPDASGVLGWSVKKTENLIYRGLADLRRCLGGKGWSP
ncbi:MAG: RNA polymerase sigma factor [Acidobacteriota bacterium]